jgi:hypothetical protein
MSAWAKPGVKCVCVDAWFRGCGTTPLVEKAVYTIRANVPNDPLERGRYKGRPVIALVEADNPWHPDGGFSVDRFRPLVPPKTQEEDVAQFRHLLSGLPVAEDA